MSIFILFCVQVHRLFCVHILKWRLLRFSITVWHISIVRLLNINYFDLQQRNCPFDKIIMERKIGGDKIELMIKIYLNYQRKKCVDDKKCTRQIKHVEIFCSLRDSWRMHTNHLLKIVTVLSVWRPRPRTLWLSSKAKRVRAGNIDWN